MEIQNHTDQDVTQFSDEDIEGLLTVDPEKTYPIRLLHLSNDALTIGFVLAVMPDSVLLVRPHNLQVFADRTGEGDLNIEAYDLVPYLNQLVEYDPDDTSPTPFMMSNIISMNIPAPHLRRNFMMVTQMKQSVKDQETTYQTFPSKGTLH